MWVWGTSPVLGTHWSSERSSCVFSADPDWAGCGEGPGPSSKGTGEPWQGCEGEVRTGLCCERRDRDQKNREEVGAGPKVGEKGVDLRFMRQNGQDGHGS